VVVLTQATLDLAYWPSVAAGVGCAFAFCAWVSDR
jgi:nitrate reductase NapE component